MHAEGVELVHSAVANPLTVDGDKETIGPLQTLRQYEALADGSHQRLGMSIEGLCLVFLRIGLIRKSLPAELQCMKIKVKTKWIQLEEARKKARKTLQNGEEPFCIYDFRYNESYERGEDVQWLNDNYGLLSTHRLRLCRCWYCSTGTSCLGTILTQLLRQSSFCFLLQIPKRSPRHP